VAWIAAASNRDGRPEAFYFDVRARLHHVWEVTPNSFTWSKEGFFGTVANDVAVAANADGRLEVFYVTERQQALVHRWQLSPGGSWAAQPGQLDSGPVSGSHPSRNTVAVTRGGDGRLYVFYLKPGSGGGLFMTRQAAANAGPWSAPVRILARAGEPIAAGVNADGRVEVFFRRDPSELWHQYEPTLGDAAFGGTEHSIARGFSGGLSVASNADGRLEAFFTGGGSLSHVWQLQPNRSWSGRERLASGGGVVAAARNANGRLEVVFGDVDGALYDRVQITPGGAWGNTARITRSAPPHDTGTPRPAAALGQDGRMLLFNLYQSGPVGPFPKEGTRLTVHRQVAAGAAWGEPVQLDRS
jgi:hypothetical protein